MFAALLRNYPARGHGTTLKSCCTLARGQHNSRNTDENGVTPADQGVNVPAHLKKPIKPLIDTVNINLLVVDKTLN
jgi:hypothetical protein